MTPSDLERDALDVLRNFWRMRAALAFLRAEAEPRSRELQAIEVRFDNIPPSSLSTAILGGEALQAVLSAIADFEVTRLRNDVLLAMIARLEAYMSDRLRAASSLPNDATFGRLQRACETMVAIPQHRIEALDEVRERRNALIHHHGAATPRYLQAASKLPSLPATQVGTVIITDDSYLSYAVGTLVEYGRCIP